MNMLEIERVTLDGLDYIVVATPPITPSAKRSLSDTLVAGVKWFFEPDPAYARAPQSGSLSSDH